MEMEFDEDQIWSLQEEELKLQDEEYQKVKHLYEKDQGKWIVFAANKCIGLFEDFRAATKAGQEAALRFNRPAALVLQIGSEGKSYLNLTEVLLLGQTEVKPLPGILCRPYIDTMNAFIGESDFSLERVIIDTGSTCDLVGDNENFPFYSSFSIKKRIIF